MDKTYQHKLDFLRLGNVEFEKEYQEMIQRLVHKWQNDTVTILDEVPFTTA